MHGYPVYEKDYQMTKFRIYCPECGTPCDCTEDTITQNNIDMLSKKIKPTLKITTFEGEEVDLGYPKHCNGCKDIEGCIISNDFDCK